MRVSELYRQVSQLGFEDSLENDSRFYYAANRALLQVSSLRPAITIYGLNNANPTNLIDGAGFAPVKKVDELCYEAQNAKAYYFECDGIGTAYVEKHDGDEWRVIGMATLDSRGSYKAYKGFIRDGGDFTDGLVRLRFVGEYVYNVRSAAMYGELKSGDIDDVPPYTAHVKYDMSLLAPDFLSLCSPPIVTDENRDRLYGGYDVEGGKIILLPWNACGYYEVRYRRRAAEIPSGPAAQENEAIIDLDEELCALLPELIAAYVWAEDEPNLAQYYLGLYNTRAAEIAARERNTAPAYMKSVNGW